MLMKKIKNIYRQYTKIPEDKMDEILKHDIWWDAEQCLEYGLVDEII
jgi:ATP-dependent protease ClpP protease subunit